MTKVLSKKGIRTLEDALYNLPRAYEDRSRLSSVRELRPGQPGTVLVRVVSQNQRRQGKKNRFEALVTDGTGTLVLNWFFSFPSLKDDFAVGSQHLVYGELKFFKGMLSMNHPDYEPVKEWVGGKPKASVHFGRVVPVYSETEGLKQKTLRRLMGEVLKVSLDQVRDPLPEPMRERLQLPSLRESFLSVHFPNLCPKEGEQLPGIKRIIFEEFFVLQLGLGLRKQRLREHVAPVLEDAESGLNTYLDILPFSLTGDQMKVLESLVEDLKKPRATARLVQGDVGSGKTVVAFGAAVIAAASGFQTALMAPTEILAQQHFRSAVDFLEPLGIRCGLLTHGSEEKKQVIKALANGELDVVVGTHALFQEAVHFSRLGLVIFDEQHRFGVEQRQQLIQKGKAGVPHVLMMTATPIPRTLSLTLYGDLDVSLIREKPPGRKPVKTRVLREAQRSQIYDAIRMRLDRGQQVYIIYPLVEASEKLELKSATEMFERLSNEIFPEVPCALLHGRMKPEEKDQILRDFKRGAQRILVATTVIEVGIDVPNATLMVIEHAERLGLSQLHQLRGRVGRGTEESECLLVSGNFINPRLRIMTKTEDGFIIAEEDLKIRGPGEFLGTRQSGLPGFRVGHPLRDFDLLEKARDESERILSDDPKLKKAPHQKIRELVHSRWKDKLDRLSNG